MSGEASGRVRGGGRATTEGFLFEISGGALCLDLPNTIDNRPTSGRTDHLERYEDLVSWAAQAEVIEGREAGRLQRIATRHPARARHALREARVLREELYAIFSAVARGRRPGRRAVARLNAALPRALSARRIAARGEGFAWCWSHDAGDLGRILDPVLLSAADLLTSDERGRVRECAAERCGWLFLDRSRNGSRRWCDMTVCGNRAKARRHYRRRRKK